MYWRINPTPLERWLYTIHPQLVWDWMLGKKPENWTPRANPFLTPLKRDLFQWSAEYQVRADWMLMQAMETMLYWTTIESDPDRQIRGRKLDRALNRILKGNPAEGPKPEELDTNHYFWGTGRKWFFPNDDDQQFIYAGWRGEDVRKYEVNVREEFDKHLSKYLDTLRTQVASLPKTPILRRPERFVMLALYLCRNMTREEIKRPGSAKTSRQYIVT